MSTHVRQSTSAFAALSRDHHHTLVIAMALSRASEATARSCVALFADYIGEHEGRHFALEEALLLPALGVGERARELDERVRADHRDLREAARRIESELVAPSVELARSLGARLREHVQLEERELFPYLAETLDPASLERLEAQIETRV